MKLVTQQHKDVFEPVNLAQTLTLTQAEFFYLDASAMELLEPSFL